MAVDRRVVRVELVEHEPAGAANLALNVVVEHARLAQRTGATARVRRKSTPTIERNPHA